jgi:steroid 5-alpha reductase family enzyme
MEWYISITISTGIGFLILSTSNLLIALNDEIRTLNNDKKEYQLIIKAKLVQLKKLNYVLIIQYLSAFLFVVGGVLGEITKNENFIVYLVFAGVVFLTISIVLLIQYSLKSLKIRQ